MRAFPRHHPEGCVPICICPRCKRCISAVSEPFPSVFGAQPVALTTAIDICNNKKCNSRGLVGWCDEGRDRLGAHAGNPAHSAGLGRRLCRRPQGPDRQCRAQTHSEMRYINAYFEMSVTSGLYCVLLVLLGGQAHRLGPQRECHEQTPKQAPVRLCMAVGVAARLQVVVIG
jgi:hypothetical protein